MMAEAPAAADPLELIVGGLRTVAETRFEPRKAALLARRELVRTDTGLQERDLRKRAAMAEAIRAGFRERGLDPARAALLAETCVTLINVSLAEWLDADDGRGLYEIILQTLATLRSTLAGGDPAAAARAGR